jgi:hypothetical protein
MKTLSVKMVMFGCYLLAVLLVWKFPVVSGFTALTAKMVLVYTGLIVATHLSVTLFQLGRR